MFFKGYTVSKARKYSSRIIDKHAMGIGEGVEKGKYRVQINSGTPTVNFYILINNLHRHFGSAMIRNKYIYSSTFEERE